MAHVINRNTMQLHRSVNTPDYPPADWLVVADAEAQIAAIDAVDVDPVEFMRAVVEVVLTAEQTEAAKQRIKTKRGLI